MRLKRKAHNLIYNILENAIRVTKKRQRESVVFVGKKLLVMPAVFTNTTPHHRGGIFLRGKKIRHYMAVTIVLVYFIYT